MLFQNKKHLVIGLCLVAGALFLSACDAKNSVDPNATFPPGPSPSPPPSPAPTLSISQIVVQPETVLPGQSSVISVAASDGTSTALNYGWYSTQGLLNVSNTNLVTWTAPVTEGTYLVSVDVSNGSEMVRAYATVRVAASMVLQPLITTVLPGEAHVDQEVRIVGNGFGATQGDSTLSIGNSAATNVVTWSSTEIVAVVPGSSVTGAVQVNVDNVVSTDGRLTVLWGDTNPSNMAISMASADQTAPRVVSDNQGGMIVVWEDRRTGNAEIYAQRVNSRGAPLWSANGVVVCDATGDQQLPRIISDGVGGAIIAWQDRRNGTDFDIYVQRIDANGVPLWTTNGIQLSGASDNQLEPLLIADAANGAIVVWEDRRNGTDFDIYAQRVDGSGTVQWTANGEPVVSSTEHQLTPRVVTDNAGGAIIIWEDYRSGSHYDIYAQRLIADGAAQWAANGVAVVNAAGNQFGPMIAADGVGGVVVVWQDYRSSTDFDIYTQRLDASGVTQWTANGVVVSAALGNQVTPSVVGSGVDAFIVGWEDYRNGISDIYAQRISATGSVSWSANGLVVNNVIGAQSLSQMVADDADGAILVWKDFRSGTATDLYLQRIDRNGTRLWASDGLAASSAIGNQLAPAIVADGNGGVILAWEDDRNGNMDIYSQGVSAGGK